MQTLTLCMIVRDEEATLPQFLAAAAGLWDELCVIDTGSIDKSTDLIRMAGGRVQNLLWNDDFAEARNACLEMASSDWVIVLDADEWVSEALVKSARAQLERRDRGACVVPFVSLGPDGTLKRANYLRMFRRHPNLRYRYRLHEDIVGAVEAHLTRTQLGVGRLTGHVDHLGDIAERQIAKDIRRRDKALYELSLREDPRDLHAWYECIRHVSRWEGKLAAAAIAPQALEALRTSREVQRVSSDGMAGRLAVAIAESLAASSADSAIALLYAWEPRLQAKVDFYVARAELLATADRPAAAAADFETALTLSHTSLDVQLACIRPLIGLAEIHQRQGDAQEAQQLVRRALGFDAKDPQALSALARHTQQVSGASGLHAAAVDYIAQYGDCAERQVAFRAYESLSPRS